MLAAWWYFLRSVKIWARDLKVLFLVPFTYSVLDILSLQLQVSILYTCIFLLPFSFTFITYHRHHFPWLLPFISFEGKAAVLFREKLFARGLVSPNNNNIPCLPPSTSTKCPLLLNAKGFHSKALLIPDLDNLKCECSREICREGKRSVATLWKILIGVTARQKRPPHSKATFSSPLHIRIVTKIWLYQETCGRST